MKKLVFLLAVMVAAIGMFTGCGAPAANNAVANNKPANAANTATAPAADAAAIETEIKKLANDGVTAITKGDTGALDKLWADNYMFVGQDGVVSTKAQRIESMKSGSSKIETLTYDEMSVRSNAEGTGAILVGRATVKGTNMGKPVDGQMRFTQVWSKTKDGWRSVSGQVTAIAAGAAKADDKKTADSKADDKKAADKAPPANK